MKKLNFLAMLFLGISMAFLTSCGDDDEGDGDNPTPQVENPTNLDSTQFIVRTITGNITSNTTFTQKINDTIVHWVLDGNVFVNSGATLTIEKGTLVKGLTNPTNGDAFSALVIARGAQIDAQGTATDPIVMTGTNDPLTTVYDERTNQTVTTYGTWGGLVILGRAPMEKAGANEATIEGFGSGNALATYGGSDPADNSGTLKYVSIRHTGDEVSPGNEIQGLTLGAVGSGTTIDYVESFASADDGIEIFGGTVNLTHVVVAFAEDDMYDFDEGYRGNIQYAFGLQGTDLGNDSRLGEWDGAIPDGADLYSKPNLANFTLVAPGSAVTSNVSFIQMRDAFGGNIINSIFTDFPRTALEVEDLASGVDSYGRLATDELNILGNVWYSVNATAIDTSAFLIPGEEFPGVPTLIDHLTNGNNSLLTQSAITASSIAVDQNQLNPTPISDASITSNFAQNLDSFTLPSGIAETTYKGAFDPNVSIGNNWMKGWTAVDKYNILAD